ncbi:MAG TPA: hypothetical protein VG345_16540 [Bryobacteraceae bacterium]|nr:hypothetical protein [Bryobacteraceae bacterium]
MLLTVKLMQAASGAEGITTNMATVKRMFERTLCLLTVENMRRGGFLEVESLPASIADETSFSYRATESGRERFKLLEQMEAKEKAAAGNGAGNGKDTPA